MASYSLLIKPSAAKELETVPKKDRLRIVRKIQLLADNPRPEGCEKLTGREQYRLRQGRFRVLYSISEVEQFVLIVKIAHQKEAYR